MSIVVACVSLFVFLLFQARGIQTGDSGDLVTAAATFGVAHPPGYPLYTLLGWIMSRIPIFTVAWRVALLSSVSHAATVGFVIDIVRRLSKRTSSAWFAGLLLLGNYLFFLYSVTPEVFALLDLFVVGVLWLVIEIMQKRSIKALYLLAFVFGLSLTHHHMILFLVPIIVWVLWKKTVATGKSTGSISLARIAALFAVGLVPYIYVPIAAHGHSVINWDHATTIPNFFRLISRADYGSFQSGAVYGSHPIERLLQIKVFGHYLFIDFGIVGILLVLAGLFALWKNRKQVFQLIVGSVILMGPVFFFYASFPVANRFTLATFERFLLPSYVLLVIIMGIGHARSIDALVLALRKITPHVSSRFISIGLVVVSILYPLTVAGMTLWRFWGLPADNTAVSFARDIFTDVPEGSLLALGRDTTLFTAQYVRYAEDYRTDTIVVHGSFLNSPAYQETMKKVFDDLVYPPATGSAYISDFLLANARNRPVFSNIRYPVGEEWFWIPHGLLFRLIPLDALPTVDILKERNQHIWTHLHDPTEGLLSRYKHLMLSDVLDVYAGSRIGFGKVLLSSGDTEGALDQFSQAIDLGGDTQLPDAHMYAGITYLLVNRCQEALDSFASARAAAVWTQEDLTLYEGITHRDCVGDPESAKSFFAGYEKLRQQKEQLLEEW